MIILPGELSMLQAGSLFSLETAMVVRKSFSVTTSAFSLLWMISRYSPVSSLKIVELLMMQYSSVTTSSTASAPLPLSLVTGITTQDCGGKMIVKMAKRKKEDICIVFMSV